MFSPTGGGVGARERRRQNRRPPGDVVAFNQTIVRTETSKVTTDVPTDRAGRVVAVHVRVGDVLPEDTLIATLEAL